MQQQRCGDAAGQRAIDRFVAVVKRVAHHHLRGDRAGGLVYVIIERDVRVRIDDAGHHELAGSVDHHGAGGRIYALADRGNLSVVNVNAAIFDLAVSDGQDGPTFDDYIIVDG